MNKSNNNGHTNEKIVNEKIAEILCEYHGWSVRAEKSGRIMGSRIIPDIIIEAHRNAVVIETEYNPASTLEPDVNRVIGVEVRGIGKVASVMGIKLPSKLTKLDGNDLSNTIKNSTFHYFIKNENNRFPKNGYLEGMLSDISAVVTLVSIPWDKIEDCVRIMKENIYDITAIINKSDDGVKKRISKNLGDSNEDSVEMASLVLLNAGIFYEEIATHHDDIEPISSLLIVGELIQSELIKAWNKVMKRDYLPIFENASEILKALPASIANDVLKIMYRAISTIVALRMTKSGDVYGALYQTMSSDRKNIAAFYTRPQAAALLANLVMPDSNDELWKDLDRLKNIRIADFACGSGMLLTHAYYHIKHCLAGDASALHKHFIEKCFFGYDIMPTGTQLTVSNLAGIYPDVFFDMTNVYTLPIGESGNGYHLGSLDLLRDVARFTVAGLRYGGAGSKNVDSAGIMHRTCDYILMNPPYTRPANHGGGRDAPVPHFDVFGIPDEIQKKMSTVQKKLYAGTCSHGNAGLGTSFMAICDKKIKLGGRLGLILPTTLITGSSWSKMRKLLTQNYDDILIIFLKDTPPTYSFDTDMNEIIITATRRIRPRAKNNTIRIKVAVIDNLPKTRLHAIEISKQILKTYPNKLEDDASNTSIMIGNNVVGKMIDVPGDIDRWWVTSSPNTDLFSLTYKLTHESYDIPITYLKNIAKIGKLGRDIDGKPPKEGDPPRGPFNKIPLQNNDKYRALWNNNRR